MRTNETKIKDTNSLLEEIKSKNLDIKNRKFIFDIYERKDLFCK